MKYSFLLFFLLFASLAEGKEINVCSQCPFPTIKRGIAACDNGDSLIIKEGNYPENNLVINNSIHIKGQGKVIIDGRLKGSIFTIHADSFSIDGLTIINVGHSYTKEFAAILVKECRSFSITNNILKNVFFGILIQKSKYGRIENNNVSSHAVEEASSGNGIHIWHSAHMEVHHNNLSGLRDGIYFEFVKKSKISYNKSHNNIRYGLHFMFSNNDEYFNNTFENNGAGVAVMFSKYINMHHNTFQDNWGPSSYGLLLKEIYDAEIVENKFKRNTAGITAEGSTRINYTANNFINNGWALKVTGACYENIFTNNNFMNNSFDLSYNSQINNNKFEHNYWSGYTGYDLNKDDIGDIPYRPVKLFSYIVNRTPETIVLLRSLFVDIINFSEKVSPVFTPDKLVDNEPSMNPIKIQ